jgi:YD repeat-containing protein
VKDWLARALDLAFAPRERRTCLVDDQAHEYELYYDARGRLMLEFLAGGVGVYAVKVELTREQHDR